MVGKWGAVMRLAVKGMAVEGWRLRRVAVKEWRLRGWRLRRVAVFLHPRDGFAIRGA